MTKGLTRECMTVMKSSSRGRNRERVRFFLIVFCALLSEKKNSGKNGSKMQLVVCVYDVVTSKCL